MAEYILRERNIIVVGQQPWDVTIGSNAKNIALEFSKNNKVLYVNSPLDRISAIKHREDPAIKKRLDVISKKEHGLVSVGPNLWNLYPDGIIESINWISIPFLFNYINKINNDNFAKSIKKALVELGFQDYILFNDNDIIRSFYLKELLKPTLSVYYSRDFMLGVPYWKKHGEKLEPLLINKSDLCLTNSTYLEAYCKQYNPNSFYVGQGCDLEIFAQFDESRPSVFKNIKGLIVGYVGALAGARLDLDIIEYLAKMQPDWTIALVGPEDDTFRKSTLHNYKNIIFTGSIPAESLPEYINGFSVCINPQVVNEITIGNYPRKIDEYLALGKPVVGTTTKAMEIFKDVIYLASDKVSFLMMIQKAILEDSSLKQKQRKELAFSHTWENSVAEMYKAIGTLNLPDTQKK